MALRRRKRCLKKKKLSFQEKETEISVSCSLPPLQFTYPAEVYKSGLSSARNFSTMRQPASETFEYLEKLVNIVSQFGVLTKKK